MRGIFRPQLSTLPTGLRQFASRLAESRSTFYNSMWEQSRNILKQSAAEQPPHQNSIGRGRRKRMKFRIVGQVLLALVVSVGLSIGVTSCTNSYTVGYLYVTGSQYNQISGFNINNQTGKLTPVQKSPFGTGGSIPSESRDQRRTFSLRAQQRRSCERHGQQHQPLSDRRRRSPDLSGELLLPG